MWLYRVALRLGRAVLLKFVFRVAKSVDVGKRLNIFRIEDEAMADG